MPFAISYWVAKVVCNAKNIWQIRWARTDRGYMLYSNLTKDAQYSETFLPLSRSLPSLDNRFACALSVQGKHTTCVTNSIYQFKGFKEARGLHQWTPGTRKREEILESDLPDIASSPDPHNLCEHSTLLSLRVHPCSMGRTLLSCEDHIV